MTPRLAIVLALACMCIGATRYYSCGPRRVAPSAEGAADTYPAGGIARWKFTTSNDWAAGVIPNAIVGGLGGSLTQVVSTKRGAWAAPGIALDGSEDFWWMPTNAVPPNEFTVNVIYKRPDNTAGTSRDLVIWSNYSIDPSYDQVRCQESAAALTPNFAVIHDSVGTVGTTAGGYVNATGRLVMTSFAFATNNAYIWPNASSTQGLDTACTYSTDPSKHTYAAGVGGYNGGAYSFATIYEVGIWHRKLTGQEITNLWTYAGATYPP